jgi:gamma-glutamylcyclotransferase (GGCT)/AIG2-like uncharacterized protein YtfP
VQSTAFTLSVMSSPGAWLDVEILARALTAGASSRLATYGSLQPGGQHHDLVAHLGVLGAGIIRGDLTDWEGYPVLAPRADGGEVRAVVYGGVNDARWSELDAFEGDKYRRELVLVELGHGGSMIATCYVAVGE